MIRRILCVKIVFILFGVGIVRGQCPMAGFSVPDSVCSGQPFLVTNTSDPGNAYTWDFCTGEMQQTPVGTNIGNPANLAYLMQMRMIKDNGKYFMFNTDQQGAKMVRYDFGSSPDNTPTVYDYGNISGQFIQPSGMDIIQESGVWYAIVVDFITHNLIRVDLGSSIEANIASAVNLGAYGSTNSSNVLIRKDASGYYAFVSATQFSRVDFGASITNAPVLTTQFTLAGVSGLDWGYDMVYDCNQNKYVGYLADYNTASFHTLDFGNSLTNTPTVAGSKLVGGNPTGLGVVKDGADIYVLVSLTLNHLLEVYKVGSDALAVPVAGFSGQIGGINFPQTLYAYQDSSRIYSFISNSFPSTITRVNWPETCSLSPTYSNDPASVSVTATIGGIQNLSLTVTNAAGLSSVYTDSVYVNEIPVSNFSSGPACEGQPVQFNDLSTINIGTITVWSWDFGDGSLPVLAQNPVHLFPGTGPYKVTLTTHGNPSCAGNSFSISITLSPLPDADFTFTNNQCQFLPVSFTDISQAFGSTTVISWLWDFGDTTATDTVQNPFHAYQSPGTYNVTLIVTTDAGCSDSITQSITILPAPVADFSVASTCVGETVIFTNLTTISGGGSINYEWNFGDLTTSNQINPTHQYALSPANYNVQLIATSTNTCTDTIVLDIRIADVPSPQFSWLPLIVCKGNPVTFSNTSTGNGTDTIASQLWDFGDTFQSTDLNPVHVYADTGMFQVSLTVVSPTNCDSTLVQQIYVIPSPIASFTAQDVCLNNPTNFNPSVSTPPGTVVDSIVWTFGDNTGFSGLTSPVHQYLAPGQYPVIMTVYNDLLCTGSFVDTVEVFPLPTADFVTSLVCSGSPTTFDGTVSTVIGDVLSSWVWDFGGTDSVTQFTFQNAGNFNVTMIVTTIHGCADTITKPIEVLASPDFDFVYNEPCLGLPSLFTYLPNVNPPPSADLVWDFGDNSLSFLLNPTHTYSLVDTFDVVLTVTEDSSGCSAAKIKPLIIHPLPTTGFYVPDVCEETQVTVMDTSSVSTGTITSWNWNLGVFGTSTDQFPVITPTVANVYPISLSVTTDMGCTTIANSSFTVFAKPLANFVPDPVYGSPPLTVNFINNTVGAISYSWEFGDSGTGTGGSPSHVYPDTGIYQVFMVATSIQGCVDSAYATVSVLIPYMDIEVTEIYYTLTQDQIKLAARILNRGNLTVTSMQVRGRLEEYSPIAELWTGSLTPGNQVLYLFESGYLIQQDKQPGYYCVDAMYPNDGLDAVPGNNSKCSSLGNDFSIYSIFPNPFEDLFTLNFNLNTAGLVEMEIFDAAGRIAAKPLSINGFEGYNSITMPTIQLAKGVYTVVVRFRDDVKRIQAVKLR